MLSTLLGLLALSAPAWAGGNHITGQVINRNGEPVPRAVVSLAPGNVQLVTDREGFFLIDYLRDDAGERVKLDKKTDYTIEIFKPGFHTYAAQFYFKKGQLTVDTVTMVEETIELQDLPENLDPALYSRPTHAAGANYEGQ
jgi:hypothetical protein